MIAIACLVLLFNTLSFTTAASESSYSDSILPSAGSPDRWTELANMQSGRGDPGVVVYNDKIHVISGYFSPGFNYSSSQEIYDPQTDSWEIRWNVPVPRSDMMAASINDKIYMIGGWRDPGVGGEFTGTLGLNHMYDPMMDTWITKTSMITPVSGAGVVVLSDTIHIIGGYNLTLNENVKSVQIYDPDDDSWTLGTPLPVGRNSLNAVVLDGMIYAIGGNVANSTTDLVEIYNPSSDSWVTGTALPEPRASMAAAVNDGKIFVIGGTDDSGTGDSLDTTYVYDPGIDSWSTSTPMPTARRTCEAAAVGDYIYVIGGAGEAGAGKANEAYRVTPITTTTTITSDDPDPSVENQMFTVSYAVTSSDGIPSGIVATMIEGSYEDCVEPLVNGVGSCEITLSSSGIYTITSRYIGDDLFIPSYDTESHIVIPPTATPTTTPTVTPTTTPTVTPATTPTVTPTATPPAGPPKVYLPFIVR